MTIIQFKSTPENWEKEFDGRKRNTVRVFDNENDLRKEILDHFIKFKSGGKKPAYLKILKIEIMNTEIKQVFEREVTDVTYFPQGNCYIISW